MNKTQFIYLANRVLCSPLEALYMLMIFILSMSANATPIQLTVLACSKPIVSLIAFNASSLLTGKPWFTRNYLIAMNLLATLPCFFFPFVDNVWFFVASYALFMITVRATFPAWSEILRVNMGFEKMGKLISWGTSINYTIMIFVPLLLSRPLDQGPDIWKTLYLSLAALHITSILLILGLKQQTCQTLAKPHESLLAPWIKARELFKERPDFAKYQALFFLGGAGIIAMQPILPIYFKETLHLSYTQLAVALSFCKGISFVLTSRLWAQFLTKNSLYLLHGFVNLITCIFVGLLLASSGHTDLLFVAYFLYGTMQSGCELAWHVSGPHFSGKEESTFLSSTNLAVIGIRGCIFPLLGYLLFLYTDIMSVFFFSFAITLTAAIWAFWINHSKRRVYVPYTR